MTIHPIHRRLLSAMYRLIKMALCLMSVAAVQLGASVAHAKEKAESHFEDGKLKGRIEILEMQGGVAGFSGTYHRIEPDGTWSTGEKSPHIQKNPTASGTLTAEQLAQLAKVMAEHDLANLPSFGEPVVNPAYTEVNFGGKVSSLMAQDGKPPTEEEKLIRARYDGIMQAVKLLCTETEKE